MLLTASRETGSPLEPSPGPLRPSESLQVPPLTAKILPATSGACPWTALGSGLVPVHPPLAPLVPLAPGSGLFLFKCDGTLPSRPPAQAGPLCTPRRSRGLDRQDLGRGRSCPPTGRVLRGNGPRKLEVTELFHGAGPKFLAPRLFTPESQAPSRRPPLPFSGRPPAPRALPALRAGRRRVPPLPGQRFRPRSGCSSTFPAPLLFTRLSPGGACVRVLFLIVRNFFSAVWAEDRLKKKQTVSLPFYLFSVSLPYLLLPPHPSFLRLLLPPPISPPFLPAPSVPFPPPSCSFKIMQRRLGNTSTPSSFS